MKLIFIALAILLSLFFAKKYKGEKNMKDNVDKIFKNITVEEAYNLIQSGGYEIIDIRTPEEFKSSKIKNSINIDFYEKDFTEKMNNLNPDKKYIMYCRSGNRSGKALINLLNSNLKELYNVKGGIIDWTKNNYPVVKE